MVRSVAVFVVVVPALLFSQEKYVGSKNSDKYHITSCQWAKRINPDNLVSFDSPEAARKEGYIPCKVCKPPLAKDTTAAPAGPQIKKQSATKQTSSQCSAMTKKGIRCKRKAKAGSTYCWQHGGT